MLLRGAAPRGARQRGLSSGSVLRRWRCHAARDASRPPSSASERRLPRREADGVSSGGLPGKKLSRKPLAEPTGLALWSSLMDVDADDSEDLAELESVLKVFCTHSEPSWSSPWQRRRQYASTSSGFFIAGKRLLTNAHSVEHSTCVSVMRRGDERKWLARVLAVSTECDLALLTVDDAAFWESQPLALSFGKLPRLQEPVAVLGYPVGGETLSVTAGVVSRIEVTEYVHGATQLLTVQIDAAINPGNSGGPVVNERGECVGVAFQSLGGDSENVGYVVPTPVVAHFLADFERNGGKAVTGFPTVGFEWQPAEAAALRASLLLPASTRPRGVLVTRVEATSPMAAVVRRGDVLVSFNGADVSCDGTTAFRAGERISFSHLVAQCFVGESAGLGLVREGNPVSVNVTLGAHTVLVPPFFDAAAPSYLVVGGCVFVAACEPYLRAEFGEDYEYEAPVPLLHALMMGTATTHDEQCVVLSQVLAAEVNVGFEDAQLSHSRLVAFQGQPVRSLSALARAVSACKPEDDPFFRFDLDGGQVVVLDAAAARAAGASILAAHGIPAAASADLAPLLRV